MNRVIIAVQTDEQVVLATRDRMRYSEYENASCKCLCGGFPIHRCMKALISILFEEEALMPSRDIP
jgi:hypothetical protein